MFRPTSEAADVEQAERRIIEEIARIQREGPTEEERQLAVTKAESEHAFSYETRTASPRLTVSPRPWQLEDELRYFERLRTVTREQIRDAARRYLPLNDYGAHRLRARESKMIYAQRCSWRSFVPSVAAAQTDGVTRTKLPNGLTVLVRENPIAPVVAFLGHGQDGDTHGDARHRGHLQPPPAH